MNGFGRFVATVAVVGAIVVFADQQAEPDARPAPQVKASLSAFEIAEARDLLGKLQVREEETGVPYERSDWMDDWPHIVDRCDLRELELRNYGHGVRTGDDCYPTAGTWDGVYDTDTYDSPGDIQIDHIVPLAEANRSHSRHWDEEKRSLLAMDGTNLWPVAGSENNSKGSRDPGKWKPPNRGVWCEYAARYIIVKHSYWLSIDAAERAGLKSMLNYCPR